MEEGAHVESGSQRKPHLGGVVVSGVMMKQIVSFFIQIAIYEIWHNG